MRGLQAICVTGGAGFIGSNFIRHLFLQPDFNGIVVNVDRLTYSGNIMNISDISKEYSQKRYFFAQADIRDEEEISRIFDRYAVDTIVHFAAESHVDRSIVGPKAFIETNVNGTFVLLETARRCWKDRTDVLFHHISTDEVYGTLGAVGLFSESSPYNPQSPYAASKAGSDHLARAYCHTFGLPVTISNASNNYGPYQYPEKLFPLMITNMMEGKPLPIYGDGKNIRDWLYVEDHCAALWEILRKGKTGESYNVGGGSEMENIQLVTLLCETVAEVRGVPAELYTRLISFVRDRPGHDRRYGLDCSKIRSEIGWAPSTELHAGIRKTVDWYLRNPDWVEHVRDNKFSDWIDLNYNRASSRESDATFEQGRARE